MAPPALPEFGPGQDLPPSTWRTWLRDWQYPQAQPTTSLGERLRNLLPGGDVAAMAEPQQPIAPPLDAAWRQARVLAEGQMGANPQRVADIQKRLTPETTAPKGPAVEGNIKGTQRPGTNPKTALPLYFAKAMGYAVPGESGGEEEARFAKAAHQALLKMTKGMTVARFLQSHQSPKTRDTFGRLLDAELRKNQSVVEAPNPEPVRMMARPPLQPSGG